MNNMLLPTEIDSIFSLLRAAFPNVNQFSDEIRQLLIHNAADVTKETITAITDALIRLVARTTTTIVLTLDVDRSRSPEEMLEATKFFSRESSTDGSHLANMPRAGSTRQVVELFRLESYTVGYQLELERKRRGYKTLLDSYQLGSIAEKYPAFADECTLVTQWKKPGSPYWVSLVFKQYQGRRLASISKRGENYDWRGPCWCGGIR